MFQTKSFFKKVLAENLKDLGNFKRASKCLRYLELSVYKVAHRSKVSIEIV